VGETAYRDWLDAEAAIDVRFTTLRMKVIDYVVVLLAVEAGDRWAVRVYDNAHGDNEMHRYNREGFKGAAEMFHRGSSGEALRSAIDAVRGGYSEMIEAWRR
jgi:hypothetical protein